MKNFYSVKGMLDYSSKDMKLWNFILNKVINIINSYNYNQINFPIIENINLFIKSEELYNYINKQIYYFNDKKNNFLYLRPEGTSSCVRFGIKNGELRGGKHKWWYFGPMFRYEKPQLGRYREFYQLGMELFGYNTIGSEIELILIINKIFTKLNINNFINLELNCIGSIEIRNKYKEDLNKFFNKNIDFLEKLNLNININKDNILKILNTKNIFFKKFLYENSPKILNYLDNNSLEKFNNIINILNNNNIKFTVNPFLFRGLDYYNDTVFEWLSDSLNNLSICSGGRYDLLSKSLGNKKIISSVGLAIGWNRIILLINKNNIYFKDFNNKNLIDLYITIIDIKLLNFIFKLSENIKNLFPNINILIDYSISNFKNKIRFINNNNNIKISLIIFNEYKIKVFYNKIFYYKNSLYSFCNESSIINELKNIFI